MPDTIFALSSGLPPAGIAVVRISGPHSGEALCRLAGTLPEPRVARYRALKDSAGELLDRAMVLWLPGPGSATGEDVAELHCHGGRAVVAAIDAALGAMPELRRATPGEFTRRAFVNGRIDLAEADGLADLLSAETDMQRRSALAMASGALSRQVEEWREAVLQASAEVEAVLDFADEDDVAVLPVGFASRLLQVSQSIESWLARPRAELLREGFRVVIAGPPNAGKSTLFNVLVDSEAAITAPTAGTTRDVLTRPVALGGVPFLFVDTAGLRDDANDAIEAIGVTRAIGELQRADLVLWLGDEGAGPPQAWEIAAQCDSQDALPKRRARHRVSAHAGVGIDDLRSDLIAFARTAMPVSGEAALSAHQHRLLEQAEGSVVSAGTQTDPLIIGECLRQARAGFDALVGRAATEDMLDALFGRFCIGK